MQNINNLFQHLFDFQHTNIIIKYITVPTIENPKLEKIAVFCDSIPLAVSLIVQYEIIGSIINHIAH